MAYVPAGVVELVLDGDQILSRRELLASISAFLQACANESLANFLSFFSTPFLTLTVIVFLALQALMFGGSSSDFALK
jgi:hypothetical protein